MSATIHIFGIWKKACLTYVFCDFPHSFSISSMATHNQCHAEKYTRNFDCMKICLVVLVSYQWHRTPHPLLPFLLTYKLFPALTIGFQMPGLSGTSGYRALFHSLRVLPDFCQRYSKSISMSLPKTSEYMVNPLTFLFCPGFELWSSISMSK